MHRHAAHRDRLAIMFAALGQRDIQRPGGFGGILEEQFVEIPHAIEQQAIGIRRLDAQILSHQGEVPGVN